MKTVIMSMRVQRAWRKRYPTTPFGRAVLRAKRRAHLARHGWCESDKYNLSEVMARRVAAQLRLLAKEAEWWPQQTHFRSSDEWREALLDTAEALSAYADRESMWTDDEDRLTQDAAAAWRWIAAHHELLWI